MSEKEKNIPKRRFKEFQDDEAWEHSSIGKTGYFYYGKSAPKWSVTKDAKTPCVRYGELYTKYTEKIDNIYSYTNIPKENLKFSTGKEVLVPRVGEDPLDFANCSWLSIPDVAIGEMISVYNTEQNPLFTTYMFNALLKYEFAKRVEGGNVSNLYYAYLEDIPVSFPSIDEQVKISNYLDIITEIITIQKIKLEKFKSLKKAYLMKILPDKGEYKPKLRFKGFTDDWEQREFSDIFNLSQGLQIEISKRFVNPGENMHFYITNEFLKSNSSEKYYIYNPHTNVLCDENDILMTRTGNTGIIVTGVKGCFHNNFFKIKYEPKNYDKHFICQYLSATNIQKKILNSAGSSTIPDLSHKSFCKLSAYFPDIVEQKRISDFLINLDSIITLHQRKLEKLQNIKKAYLKEMFI